MNAPRQTPQQLAESRRRDVMAFAYRGEDGRLYSINENGRRIPAPQGTPALDAEHQRIAEQTAALVMSYNRVLAVTPEARGVIASLLRSPQLAGDHIRSASAGTYAQVRLAMNQFGVELPEHAADLVLGETTGGIARQITAGFSTIPTAFRDAIASGRNLFGELSSGEISRENAIAIGTAYASARQAAAADRPAEIGARQLWDGIFSANIFTYLGGLFSWVADKAIGILERLPIVGNWIKNMEWSSNLSLAEHIHGRSRENDNDRVAREMGKLSRIGGVNTADLAPLLARGGVVRTREGEREVVPADRTNPAPVLSGGASPATPAEAEQQRREQQPTGTLLGRTAQAVDFSATGHAIEQAGWTGLTVGAAVTGQAVRGVAEGAARSSINGPQLRAASAEKEEARLRTRLERVEQATPNSNAWQSWRRTEEGIANERDRLDSRITETKERYVGHSDTANARTANAGRFTQTAMTPLREINKADDAGFLRRSAHRIWNAPRSLGRRVGYVTGMVAETADHYGGRVVERVGSVVARVPGVGPQIAERITPQLSRAAIPGLASVAGAATDTIRSVTSAIDGDGIATTTSAGHAVGGVLGTAAAVSTYAGALAAMGVGAKAGASAGAAGGFFAGGVGAIPGGVLGAIGGAIVGTGGYFVGRWAFGESANDVGRLVFGSTSPQPTSAGGLTVEMIPPAPQERMSPQLRALVEANQARLAAQAALDQAMRAMPPDNPGAKRAALEATETRLLALMEQMNPAQAPALMAEIRALETPRGERASQAAPGAPGATGAPDPGLAAAMSNQHVRAQREARLAVTGESSITLGAVLTDGNTVPAGIPARPGHVPIPPVAREVGMDAMITF
jgi:hypothetical protein